MTLASYGFGKTEVIDGMDLLLSRKTVVITGASGGIGRALARAFADEGASLVLVAHRNGAALADWCREQEIDDRAWTTSVDVTDADAVAALFDAVVDRCGRVDAAVVNAGIWPAEAAPLDLMEPARIRRVLDVNLAGAVFTARGFLRALRRTGPRADGHGASVTLVGSTAGRFGEAGHVEYATSKAGLKGLLLSLKNEIVGLDPGGRANLVEPGWTVTELTRSTLDDTDALRRVVATMPLQQIATAEDVARVVVALTSPAIARHVSGETITVAGGMEGRLLVHPDDVDPDAVRARA